MPDEEQQADQTKDDAQQADAPSENTLRQKVLAILGAFDGKETAITDAGRENTRTINRLARLAAVRHLRTDKTFRHNISYYQVDGLDEEIMVGARRAGNGVWTLVATPAPPASQAE